MTKTKALFSVVTVPGLSFSAFAADKHATQTLVMDIEITGDSSVKGDKEDNLKKINHFSNHLRTELQDKTAFTIVDGDAVVVATTPFQTEENVLQCNGCEIALAEGYDAGLVDGALCIPDESFNFDAAYRSQRRRNRSCH